MPATPLATLHARLLAFDRRQGDYAALARDLASARELCHPAGTSYPSAAWLALLAEARITLDWAVRTLHAVELLFDCGACPPYSVDVVGCAATVVAARAGYHQEAHVLYGVLARRGRSRQRAMSRQREIPDTTSPQEQPAMTAADLRVRLHTTIEETVALGMHRPHGEGPHVGFDANYRQYLWRAVLHLAGVSSADTDDLRTLTMLDTAAELFLAQQWCLKERLEQARKAEAA